MSDEKKTVDSEMTADDVVRSVKLFIPSCFGIVPGYTVPASRKTKKPAVTGTLYKLIKKANDLTKVEAFDAGAVLIHAVDAFDDGTEMKYDAILVPDDSNIEVVRDRALLYE